MSMNYVSIKTALILDLPQQLSSVLSTRTAASGYSQSMSAKSLRLNFKGEKPAKKKKSSKKRKIEQGEGLGNSSDVEDVGGDEQAWVPAYSAIDIAGPAFFFQRSGSGDPSPSFCLSLNPTSQQVVPSIVKKADPIDIKHLPSNLEIDPELLEGAQIEQPSGQDLNSEANQFIPQSVHQVWVANRVADSDVWTLRSAESKFLSSDKHGVVTATSEARGPQEGWELIPLPPALEDLGPVVALKSTHGTLLGTDEVAGGKKVIRADVTLPTAPTINPPNGNGESSSAGALTSNSISEIQPSERWEVRVQWKHRHAARERARGRDSKKQKGDGRERAAEKMTEEQLNKSRQAWGAGRSGPIGSAPAKITKADRKALAKAEKEGRLAEELLDRRSKNKHDKFA